VGNGRFGLVEGFFLRYINQAPETIRRRASTPIIRPATALELKDVEFVIDDKEGPGRRGVVEDDIVIEDDGVVDAIEVC